MQRRKFDFIDLFAGVGGMRIAAERSGGMCVFSSEWDKFSCRTYQANFGELPAGDITKIDAAKVPGHGMLLAGFPCQPFSHAGHKHGFNDTRGTLFFDVARIIEAQLPQTVLLENVKGLRGHDHGRTFARIQEILESMGYVVHSAVLNARDFGLPQNRERFLIVGVHESAVAPEDFRFPIPPRTPTRLGTILERRVADRYTISDRLWAGHIRRRAEHGERGNGWGYSMFNRDSTYTSTLSARYYKDGSEILIEQSGNPRRLTPREAARLQGFPEDFVIPVSDTQAYRQFGNSVPIPMIQAVVKRLARHIASR